MLSKAPTKKHFVVLGAGISGLAMAWYLSRKYGQEIDLTILESQSRPGGWVQSVNHEGFLFEQGPRSCRPHGAGAATLALIEELGLQNELIFADSAAKQRYLYTSKGLVGLPRGLMSLPFSPFTVPLIKGLWKDWRTPKGDADVDESIAAFTTRRLGRDIAEQFLDPLVSGIYAGDMHRLSFKSCFPQMYAWEQSSGSLLKGAFTKKARLKNDLTPFVADSQKKGLFSLKNGMESLIWTLADKLKECLRVDCGAVRIEFAGGKTHIYLQNGQSIVADELFTAIPPSSLALLLEPHNPSLAESLASIPSASVGIVNVGYRQQKLQKNGFGYLIPSKEKQKALGVVWDSSAFSSQNQSPQETRLTVMIGEKHLPKGDNAELAIEKIAFETIADHLNIHDKPDSILIKVAKNAIPQYHVGHAQKLQDIEASLQKLPAPITLLGNGFYGVAVNDCIAKAKSVAESFQL